MTILQSQIDDAPKQLRIDLPPEWEHRRLEVIVRAINEPVSADACLERPSYRHWRMTDRVMLNRGTLHERNPIDTKARFGARV